MTIVGDYPETGLRLELERPRAGGPPWIYDGDAVTPTERIPIRATVDAGGEVSIDVLGAPTHAELATKAKLIVRAAYKHAKDDDPEGAPPRRIVRWRGEK